MDRLRRGVLVVLAAAGCGGAAVTTAPKATSSAETIPRAEPTSSASSIPAAPLHTPTFALPKPQPPVPATGKNPGINPPTIESLSSLMAAMKRDDPKRVVVGRQLAMLCRALELRERDDASSAKDEKSFLAARKRYELARHCVTGTDRKLIDETTETTMIDDVYFGLAAEYDDRRRFAAEDDAATIDDRARGLETWTALVVRYPKSKYAPVAWRRIADEYFESALSGKPHWLTARDAYEKAASTADPSTDATHAYARYRLGYVHWNRGDEAEAKTSLRAAIEAAQKAPGVENVEKIAAAAQTALLELP